LIQAVPSVGAKGFEPPAFLPPGSAILATMPNRDERRAAPASSTQAAPSTDAAAKACPVDLSIQCPTCGTAMQPEHAHYRCLRCGYRDSCCM